MFIVSESNKIKSVGQEKISDPYYLPHEKKKLPVKVFILRRLKLGTNYLRKIEQKFQKQLDKDGMDENNYFVRH